MEEMREAVKQLESKGHSRTEILVVLVREFDFTSEDLEYIFAE